jgi:hypothetical protein
MTANGTGQANPHGSVELAPLTYWNEAIPMATMNATFYFSGTEFDLQGFGGHWRTGPRTTGTTWQGAGTESVQLLALIP